MEKETKKKRKWEIRGVRYIFAINGLIGLMVIYSLRININVALLAMVNGTAVYSEQNSSTSNECPNLNLKPNSTEIESKKDGPYAWSPITQGSVLSAFFYTYWISQIPGGWLADMYSGKWVFGLGALLTSLLTLLTPVAANYSVYALVAVRSLQGLFQGVALPSMNALLSRWLPDTEKGFLNTLVRSGALLATIIALPLTGYLCETDFLGGWPSAFYVAGLAGVAWFAMWCALVTDSPQTHPLMSQDELFYIESNQQINHNTHIPPTPWKEILKSGPFWTYAIVQVCADWVFFTLMTNLPTYFDTILHFPLTENGLFTAFPNIISPVIGLVVTIGTDHLIRKNKASTIAVRKVCNSIGMVGMALGFVGVCFAGCDITYNKLLFFFTIGIGGVSYSGCILTPLDLSPEYAGTLLGIASTLSNLTGFLTPLVVGALTNEEQTLVKWRIVFGIAAVLSCLGAILFVIFGSAEKQHWAKDDAQQKNSANLKDEKCEPVSGEK